MKTLKALVLGTLAATALSTQAMAADAKACWVYVGPIGDFGWSHQHHQGLLDVEAFFGDRVETSFLESVATGADAERAMERFARSGCDIIFATSFGYMETVNTVAEKFPDVKFEHATGFMRDHPNVSTYSSKFYQGRYILGQIAASVSESGVSGYIASFPIPDVIRGINSFMLGAQSVNPDFEVKVVWVNTWFDPATEADAAQALFDQGVDMIAQHTDSTAAMQTAEERGANAFGQSSDMFPFGESAQLTSIVNDWGPYYIERVQAVIDGTWESVDVWNGLAEGNVAMAPYWNMPYDIAAMAKATEQAIAVGRLEPFTGPVNRQDGTPWLAEGETASVGDLRSMNFYVEGVDDQLPE